MSKCHYRIAQTRRNTQSRLAGRASRRVLSLLIATPLIAGGGIAQAGPLQEWGVDAHTQVAVCASAESVCVDAIDGSPAAAGRGNVVANSQFDGVLGRAFASASLVEDELAAAPVLRAAAFAGESDGGAFATAFAVQGYRFIGEAPARIDLAITLDALLLDATPDDADTTVVANLRLYHADPAFTFADAVQDFRSVEATPFAGRQLAFIGDSGGRINDSIALQLDPGEMFYLLMRLSAATERDGSSADASSTLRASFGSAAGLLAVERPGAVVPAPALAAGMLIALLGVRRRR